MQIGFVLFPNLTQLDFTGPLQVLHRLPGAETDILARTLAPVPSDCGLSLVPTATFADAPDLDLICVPGGHGVREALRDAETMDFIAEAGRAARYVTSVCTGALLLGAAGLLDGKKATTHWGYTHLLQHVGAIYTPGRVVRDGNVFTGGGVTAGIDFALTLVRELADERTARALQLALEYNPDPPFEGGHPDVADAATTAYLRERVYADAAADLEAILTGRREGR